MLFIEEIKTRILIKAAKAGKTDVLEALLDEGIDVNTKDNNGMTPLMWAAYKCHLTAVELLLENDADVNAKNNDGKTAFNLAEGGIYTEIIEVLKQGGAME
jgi:ankyrin repeat protein